jgi:NADH-quinone oxidoreductase subunit M
MKYTMYMMFGGIPLLFAIILLALNAGNGTGDTGDMVFSLPQLLQSPPESALQGLVFFLLVLGFAVKAPLFPFHTWLPTVAMEAPAQVTAILVGLKLGVFGLLRFALPLAPEAAVEYAWVLGFMGALTLVYAAFIALQQSNLRRMLAYASISHVGLVVIGIAALNIQGIQGAIFQLLNFTMVASGLMFLCGFLQQRTGSTDLVSLGGMAGDMPRMTTLFFILALASIGLPGTSGFAAELLLIISAFNLHFSYGLLALLAIILGAAYLLTHARRTFWGPLSTQERLPYADLKVEELLILLPACAFVLVLGLFPNLVLDLIADAAQGWLAGFP